jgi:anti-sigma factor RsiW
MKCLKSKKIISSYIDGELSMDEKVLLESHMNECSSCSRELEEMKSLHELFVNAEKFNAPYGFDTRVMANVNHCGPRGSSLIPLFVRVAEMIVVIVIIITGIISGSFMMISLMPQRAENITSSFSIEIFDAVPPDSVGGIYLSMMEVRNEK